MNTLAVVALGGNALLRDNEEGTIEQQEENTYKIFQPGIFSEGSLAPKIRVALPFIKQGGQKSIITESAKLDDKAFGTKITMKYDERDLQKYDQQGN